MRLRSAVLLAACIFAGSRPASAQLTQVFSQAGLNGPLTTHDFEATGPYAGASYTSGIYGRYSSCGASSCVTSSGDFEWVSSRPLTITFTAPTTAVGMFFGNDDRCCASGFTAFLSAYNGMGLIGTVSVVANMNDYIDQYIGFNSTTGVDYVELEYGSGAAQLVVAVDDVSFNDGDVDATPEPASLVLVGTGLLGLAGVARRRRVR